MRIAFDYWIDGEPYGTRYCEPDEIMETIKELQSNSLLEIKKTYLTNDYGVEIRKIKR